MQKMQRCMNKVNFTTDAADKQIKCHVGTEAVYLFLMLPSVQ